MHLPTSALALALATTSACALPPIHLFAQGRTRHAVAEYLDTTLEIHVEGASDRWDAETLARQVHCVRAGLDAEAGGYGHVIVTDDPGTFLAYLNFWQSLFGVDVLDRYAAFAWSPPRRGQQSLSDADWLVIVYSPNAQGHTPLKIVVHELQHVLGLGEDQLDHRAIDDVAAACGV